MTETATATTRREAFKRWSPTAFLVAGLLLLVAAVVSGVTAFQGVERSAVGSIAGPAGLAVGCLALLGMYPLFAERTPWLARAGGVFAVLGVGGYIGISLGNLVLVVGGIPDGTPALAIAFVPALALGTLLGFLLFAVASLRAGVHSRAVGLLLLVPTAAFLITVAGEIIGYKPIWDDFALSSGQAVALLTLGYLLQTKGVPTDRTEPTLTETRHD